MRFACGPKISKLNLLRIVLAKFMSEDCIMVPFLVGIILVMESLGTYLSSFEDVVLEPVVECRSL